MSLKMVNVWLRMLDKIFYLQKKVKHREQVIKKMIMVYMVADDEWDRDEKCKKIYERWVE